MCIFSHSFYCCYKPLSVLWAFAVLWSFPLFPLYSNFFSFFLFSLIVIFNLLNLLYFFYIYSFVCLSTVLSPLQLIFNVYKSSSTSVSLGISALFFFSFFPFLSTYLQVLFSLLYSPLGSCFSFVLQFVL